jgi:hypothetical protein
MSISHRELIGGLAMGSASGILLAAAAIGFGSFDAASASADPIVLIGPTAPVVSAGGLSIQVPAAASEESRRREPTEAGTAPITTLAAPAYDVICAIRTQTLYDWRDADVCK